MSGAATAAGPAPVIDCHAHVIVPEITREAAPSEGWRPRVYDEDGRQVVEMGGFVLRAVVSELVDVDRIVEARRARGIDVVALSPYVPLLFCDVEAEEALRRCRIQNDALAARVGPRVAAYGAVPLQAPELAADELRALMATGRFVGVEIPTDVDGVPLGDERFEPFWEAAAQTAAVVFIHPTAAGFRMPGSADFGLDALVGNTVETTVAVAHLTLAGVMERHPRLRVLLAHAGGAVLALRGRLARGHACNPRASERLRESPLRSLERFFYDTVVYDRDVLRSVVAAVGADRVLMGSDHPFTMEDPDPVASVRALGLAPDDEAAVLGANAVRLTPAFAPA